MDSERINKSFGADKTKVETINIILPNSPIASSPDSLLSFFRKMTNQTTYNIPRTRTWRERLMRNYGMVAGMPLQYDRRLPRWLVGKSIVCFFITMLASWIVFGYIPASELVIVAGISVVLFFALGYVMAINWMRAGEKLFLQRIFGAGLVVRLIWVLYMYFIFNPEHYATTFGDTADTVWFMGFAKDLAIWLRGGTYMSLAQVIEVNASAIDDVGYPMWLAIEYVLTGGISDVFIPLLVKCLMSAYCAICIYRVAKRHFGLGTARLAAIFVCINPNMIYWCSTMMKEAEMVFICCFAVDKLDEALSSGNQLTFRAIWPGLMAGLYLFFMRTALGLALFLAVMAHIVFASRRVIGFGKKVVAGLLVVMVLFIGVGDRLINQSKGYVEDIQSGYQEKNMEWRSERDGGNDLAKYAGAAVFAPLIFTIPFPTFNSAEASQLLQVQLAGGSFIKNILSYFVVVVLVLLIITGEWRRHVFILAYTCAYLGVLVFSGFAQSGRFHMPIWPMLMLLAAYGVQIAKGNAPLRRGFTQILLIEMFVCLAWNWFKLKGRGMI